MNNENQTSNYLEGLKNYRMQYYCKNKAKLNISSKAYYESNKEKCLERMKTYRDINKDVLNQKKNTKITCECGSSITLSNKAKHTQSKKHQNAINKTPITTNNP